MTATPGLSPEASTAGSTRQGAWTTERTRRKAHSDASSAILQNPLP
jgi:hypothetical protein